MGVAVGLDEVLLELDELLLVVSSAVEDELDELLLVVSSAVDDELDELLARKLVMVPRGRATVKSAEADSVARSTQGQEYLTDK